MRAIDADKLFRELTALSHGGETPGWTYEGLRLLIERQPTLTPPNEPLTPDGLDGWNGRPAWLVPLGEQPWDAQWAVMRGEKFVVQSKSNYMGMYFLDKGDCGDDYLAYRYPPEKEEDIR